MTKRVKLVIIMTITGNSPSRVMTTRICIFTDRSVFAPGTTPDNKSCAPATLQHSIIAGTASAAASAPRRRLKPGTASFMLSSGRD